MKQGFTLIELLVVVLIIGILATVALPQYQKAVEKSKATQALSVLKSIQAAQQMYYLSNGQMPSSFSDLDIELNWDGNTTWLWAQADAALDTRSNKEWSLQLTSSGIYMGRISGDYKGAGFILYTLNHRNMPPNRLICAERRYAGLTFSKTKGDYCEKLYHAKPISNSGTDAIYAYYMP